ncbi:MAG: ABC transporter substrate-binding protein, partial [Candidatus Caldatribacteriaceae bacterium]
AEEPQEIAVIVKEATSSFWQNVAKGAADAEKELVAQGENIKVTFIGPEAETKIEQQVNLVDNAINRKVRAIVLAPSDPDALIPVVMKAKDAGIPVVIIDSLLNTKEGYVSFLATDNRAAGILCANELIKRAGTKGKVAVMSYVPGVGSEIGRVGGFIDTIKEKTEMEIVGPFYSQSEMVTALNQTVDVLSANPDMTAIFGANEPTAIGMGRAIEQLGLAGKIVAIGFDGNKDLQDMVRNNTLQGIAVQNPYRMGYEGVKIALTAAKGEKVPEYVDTGVVFVTKENIDSEEAKQVLY